MVGKWVDIGIAVAGAVLLSYGLLQTQEVRISRTEQDLTKIDAKIDRHLVAHEQQNQELLAAMSKIQTDIQVILTKIQLQEHK